MAMQETVVPRRRGPKPTGKGESLHVRLQPALLAALDAWIEANADPVCGYHSRPEAVRRLLAGSLNKGAPNDEWMASFDNAEGGISGAGG